MLIQQIVARRNYQVFVKYFSGFGGEPALHESLRFVIMLSHFFGTLSV